MKRNKVAVIGLGNRLMADEGAGMHAVELLREKVGGQELPVDLVEAGTPGMNLLHMLDEREKIIFLDAGNCGVKPGQYRKFRPPEVVSLKTMKGYSLHEFDLIRFLEFAGRMGKTATLDIVIFCVQAAEIAMSEELSPEVSGCLPFLIEDVYNEIKEEVCHA